MIRRRCFPLSHMSLTYICWSGESGPLVPSRMTSENPMIELSGVLSSWEIFDRNSDFALFAASAAFLDSSSSRVRSRTFSSISS